MSKKYIICLVLLIGIIFLNGCDGDTVHFWDSKETKTLKKKKLLRTMSLIMGASDTTDSEIITLLSCKYSIPEDTLIQLLKDYRQPPIEAIVNAESLTTLELLTSTAPLGKLSIKYNITKEKLASIIIDYKILAKEFTILE